jgi:hypothetical protein
VVALVSAPAGIYNVCDDTPLTRHEWMVSETPFVPRTPRPERSTPGVYAAAITAAVTLA